MMRTWRLVLVWLLAAALPLQAIAAARPVDRMPCSHVMSDAHAEHDHDDAHHQTSKAASCHDTLSCCAALALAFAWPAVAQSSSPQRYARDPTPRAPPFLTAGLDRPPKRTSL